MGGVNRISETVGWSDLLDIKDKRRARKSVRVILNSPLNSSRTNGRFARIGLVGSQLRRVAVYSFWNLSNDSLSTSVFNQKDIKVVLLDSYTSGPDCITFGMKYAVNFRVCSVSRSDDHDSGLYWSRYASQF